MYLIMFVVARDQAAFEQHRSTLNGSPNGSPNVSPNGSLNGSPNGSPNGSLKTHAATLKRFGRKESALEQRLEEVP